MNTPYVDQLFHSTNYALFSCSKVALTDRFADAQVKLEELGKIIPQNCKQINDFQFCRQFPIHMPHDLQDRATRQPR
jgi:hypothetical protein